MAIVTTFDHAYSLEIRGKLGRPNELGAIWCGLSECGEYLPVAGIYQKRPTRNGQIFVRMKHYHGGNPQTIPQQANRSTFAAAVAAWKLLNYEQKKYWRGRKEPRYMSGYNRYIREYMHGNVI